MHDAPGRVNHQIRALAAVASTVLFGLGPVEARTARPKGRETEDAAHRRHAVHGKRARFGIVLGLLWLATAFPMI
jgi:hypothetical protein